MYFSKLISFYFLNLTSSKSSKLLYPIQTNISETFVFKVGCLEKLIMKFGRASGSVRIHWYTWPCKLVLLKPSKTSRNRSMLNSTEWKSWDTRPSLIMLKTDPTWLSVESVWSRVRIRVSEFVLRRRNHFQISEKSPFLPKVIIFLKRWYSSVRSCMLCLGLNLNALHSVRIINSVTVVASLKFFPSSINKLIASIFAYIDSSLLTAYPYGFL